MEPPGAACLWPPHQPDIIQDILYNVGRVHNPGPINPGHRVQIHPQFVRVVKILRTDRVRVEVQTSEIHHPRQAGSIADHRLLRGGAGRVVESCCANELRMVFRDAFLEERFRVDALGKAFEYHRTAAGAA